MYFRQRRRRGSLDAQRFLFQPEMPPEGGLVGGLHVVGIQNLQELLNYCCEGKMPSLPSIENQKKEDGKEPDFSEVQGQTAARRRRSSLRPDFTIC